MDKVRRKLKIYEWLVLIVVFGFLYMIITSHFKMNQYEDDISTKDDSINSLNQLNSALEIEFQVLESSLLLSEDEIEDYQGSIDSLKRKIKQDKTEYEKEIADIISIPSDSLYGLVTNRLR